MRIMMNMCYKTFIWFLLIGVFEIVANSVAEDQVKKIQVNFGEMASLLKNVKSVFINSERFDLDSWLPYIIKHDKEVERGRNPTIMFTFIKCESAYLIAASFQSIIDSVKPCTDRIQNPQKPTTAEVEPCATRNADVINYLESLNGKMKLAVRRLFEIVHRYPILRSDESYFTRTVLTVCYYLNGFTYVKERVNGKMLNPSIVLTILKNLYRVLPQIVTLVGHFTLEYCYTHHISQRNPVDELNNFLLRIVDSSTTVSSYDSLSDMSEIPFGKCMQNNDADTNSRGSKFCHKYIKTADIQRHGPDHHEYYGFTTVRKLFEDVINTFDLQPIYEYVLAVYQVVLKLIFLKMMDQWQSLGAERCEAIIAKIESTNCPLDMIQHFQLILDIERNKNYLDSSVNETATNIFTDSFDWVKRVTFPFERSDEEWAQLSLWDLMDVVLEDELFKHFWRIFNLLNKEFRNKSPTAYDMSLDLSPGQLVLHETTRIRLSRCRTVDKVTEFLSKFQPLTDSLSQDFIDNVVDGLNTTKHADVCNIYKLAHIQLEDYKEVRYRNGELLKRRINLIWNMFDNYTIQNCRVHHHHHRISAFKKSFDNNVDENELVISEIKKNENLAIFSGIVGAISPFCSGAFCKKHTQITVFNFYTLLGRRIIDESYLGAKVYFDWRGEMISIIDIREHISENRLDIQVLIDYQKLCFKVLINVIHEAWFALLETKYTQQLYLQEPYSIDPYTKSLKELYDTLRKLFIPIPFRKYIKYYYSKLSLYSFIAKQRNYSEASELLQLIRMEVMIPVSKLLGIVVPHEHPVNIADCYHLLGITEFMWNIAHVAGFSVLFKYIHQVVNKVVLHSEYFLFERVLHFNYSYNFVVT